jgi:putative RecB family exonuclease
VDDAGERSGAEETTTMSGGVDDAGERSGAEETTTMSGGVDDAGERSGAEETTTMSAVGSLAYPPSMSTTPEVEPAADLAVERVPTSLSPSRAADFKRCPLLYRFRAIDRLPEVPSAVATRGTLVHAVLERLFDLPAAERTLERARSLVAPEWARLQEAEPELAGLFGDDTETLQSWLASADDLLDTYFGMEDPTRLEPAERELLVETTLDSGVVLRGYVDRLDVAPGGQMRVVDYKTGNAPMELYEARAMFQMRFYALVLWKLHGRIPASLKLLYLGSNEVLEYCPDEGELRATERMVEAIWAAVSRATETGDWRPSPGRLCEWCDHQVRCPAFGNEPPPLPAVVDLELSSRPAPVAHTTHDPVDDV